MSALVARRLLLAGMALAGVVFGHTLTYVLAIGEPQHRSVHLAEAGHSYWGAALWVAITIAVCSAVVVFAAGLRRRDARPPLGGSALRTGAALALLQMCGFALMETVERLVTGTDLSEMITHDLMAVGLAVQVLVGFLGAALLRWLLRAGALLAVVLAPLPGDAAGPVPLLAEIPGRPAALLSGAWGARGPPLVAAW